ncbi:CLUMA_CG001167, isoform A [Clunio marinus]|uniref:Elongator complex protein 4 n=1 Tax=Clunio marinus TaxID=568069 RepID=A0A1J1HH82_9DIPT|nr:CLUMA_CG001167, isoform A [Clunio marinus]
MSSFVKLKKDNAIDIKGVKTSLRNGQVTSSGCDSLDFVLGGGLEISSLFLVGEDKYARHSNILTRLFLADGFHHGHKIYFANIDNDPREIMKTIPPGTVQAKEISSEPSENDLRIAFRYQALPKIDSVQRGSQPSVNYDLSKKVDKEVIQNNSDITYRSFFDAKQRREESDQTFFDIVIKDVKKIAKENHENVLRVCISALGSPLWYSQTFSEEILRFLVQLKSLARYNENIVCFLTMPVYLLNVIDDQLIYRIRKLVDCNIDLESFDNVDKQTNAVFKQYHGLLHVKKLQTLSAHQSHKPESFDLAFKLKSHRFLIEKLHLPPELEETASSKAPTMSCATSGVKICQNSVDNKVAQFTLCVSGKRKKMANPRKFSEKIALLNQKEAEGNAEFERIMREVSEVSAKVTQAPRNTNLIATTSAFISRSLPNVNAPINDTNIANIIDNKDEATTLAGLLTTPGYSNDITKNSNSSNGKASSRESRGRSVGGGPMRSRSRNIDTSPYSSNNTAYLSPPESGWRRTSSDSAINQSLAQADDIHNSNVHNSLMLSPRAHKRLVNSNSMKNLNHQQQHQQQQHHQSPTMNQQHSHSQQNMPQSTFDPQTLIHQQHHHQTNISQQHLTMSNLQDVKSRSASRLPGINVYQTQNDDTLQIPVGNSTGSLPDLTLVHYQQSPISAPIDLELTGMIIQGSNNSTYTQQSSPIPIDTNHQRHHQHQQQQQHSPLHHQSYPNNSNQISPEKMMSYRNANAASPSNLSSSQGNLSKNSYRNSPHTRPSPGSSPNSVPGLSANFDSNSSAPCSPSPLTTSNNGQFDTFASVDNFYINPSIQQHFEQFSLMNDNYNAMMDESPNRQSSPTNQSNTPSRTNARSSNSNNHMNHQTNNNSNNHQTSNGNGSPHSPLSNDSMLGSNYDNMNCDSLRGNLILGSPALDSALMNGVGSGNGGINDIMLGGGLGSDSSSKLITSSSAALQTTRMMSQTSPSHHLNNTQTTTSIPEIVFSDYSSGSDFARDFLAGDNFLEQLGTTELQMFENANIIDPTIEDGFRRDLY